MVMSKMAGDRILEISVSDPSRRCSRAILTVSGIYTSNGNSFATIPNERDQSTMILVDLPVDVSAGDSVTVKL